jgi:hypothetical protein
MEIAVTDDDNLKAVGKFYNSLFNRDDVDTDFSVLDDIRQRPTETELGHTPTRDEILQALKKMKNNKAPGESGVSAEALKALSNGGQNVLIDLIQNFWNNQDLNYDEWNTAVLKLLHKKGSKKLLTNYRGLALQDMTARLTSFIIAQRLNKLVKKNGLKSQFASVGTADAQYVLRTALQLRREHDLESHVLFVDLIKAFDTANHRMLFALLEKFGAPKELIDPIVRLHKNFKLKFKLGKKEVLINYTTGVKQGDNIAPSLFLFLMQGMAEYLENKHKTEGTSPSFIFKRPRNTNNGKMKCQPNPAKTKGIEFALSHTLFVDDTAIVADSCDELGKRGEEIYHLFRKFGLLMHVGEFDTENNTWKSSKSEAMYFPKKNVPYSRPEPQVFEDQKHRIEYTDEFKYLGCTLTPDLLDDKEITKRIKQSKAQIANLHNLFRSSASLWVKKLVFQAIPVNTLLFGCETWTLTESNKKKISAAYHYGLRKVLGLRMTTVEKHRIKNEHVRNKLGVPHILDIVRKRQHDFLGKIASMHTDNLQRRFLGAWIPKPRPIGAPKFSMRHTHTETLIHTLGEQVITTPHANLAEWIELTTDRNAWKRLGSKWIANQMRYSVLKHGYHPKLGEPVTRPPCEKKTRLTKARPLLSPALETMSPKTHSHTSEESRLQEHASRHNLDRPDTY